jgi:hypothetical protein
MKGTLLIRRPEIVGKDTKHQAKLSFRQVALDNDVYYVIKQAYKRLEHAGYRKTYEAVRLNVYSINREKYKWFIDYYRRCKLNRPNYNKTPL